MELWKPVIGFEEYYEVSNTGRIRQAKSHKAVKCTPDFSGYPKVGLYVDGKTHSYAVHRLAAIAFIPNPDNKPQVHHKDNNKTNNHVENLQWCTPAEHGKLRRYDPDFAKRLRENREKRAILKKQWNCL